MLWAYRRSQLHSIIVERGAPGSSSTCFAPGAIVRPFLFEEDRAAARVPVGLVVWVAPDVDFSGIDDAFVGVLWSGDPPGSQTWPTDLA